MMMQRQILNRWSYAVLWSGEAETVKDAIHAALAARADLRGADLTPIRDDLWAVLSSAPAEVPALLAALKEGRVDGSTYDGTCACLVGTLANARGCDYGAIPGLSPNSARPAERFFLAIQPGQMPETHAPSRIAVEWVEQWIANVRTLAP
jgi:hypothetical protein